MRNSSDGSRDLNRRQFLAGAGSASLLWLTGTFGCKSKAESNTIKVGILQSLSGTMAISEAALRDAAMLAIEEINAAGGVLGRKVVAIVEDAASDPARFQRRAEKLLVEDKVCSVFGCWTSQSRKAVLPVFEKHDGLLWYPLQYEGNECTRNVIYTGSTPNQQITPALEWLHSNGHDKFYLIGSDYIFPRTANKIAHNDLARMGATVVGEEYFPLGHKDFDDTVKRVITAKPGVIFSTINGDSNLAFYKQLSRAGITAKDIPVMAMSIAEVEVRHIASAYTTGHFAAWSYFQSVNTPENVRFVANFQDRFGDRRVTSDPIEAAYFQVYLWAQSVEKSGSTQVDDIRAAAAGQTLKAPQGTISLDLESRHTWKMIRIGKIREDGQFEIVHASERAILPQPWDPSLNDGRHCEWKSGRAI
jgi:urea transport system substrate-binding protein